MIELVCVCVCVCVCGVICMCMCVLFDLYVGVCESGMGAPACVCLWTCVTVYVF